MFPSDVSFWLFVGVVIWAALASIVAAAYIAEVRAAHKKIQKLKAFIADFVDYARVDEVLARRANSLARNCASVVELQVAKVKPGADVESIEKALAEALRDVDRYKPEFFRPLDGLEDAGYGARGTSHKAYLLPDGNDLIAAVDAARSRISNCLRAQADRERLVATIRSDGAAS